MASLRNALSVLVPLFLVGCGPGIRFRPGEIPSPGHTDPYYIQSGQQLHTEIVTQKPILRDPNAEKRVERILKKLLAATPTTGHWKATLVNDPTFNAMTVPGNYIFVFRGILDTLPDDEVAAVLAHEIAHRLAEHELETSGQRWGKALAMLATIAAGAAVASQQGATQRNVQDVMDATHKIGSGFTTLRYSKDKEREADQIGIFLLADAGFNPSAAVSLWARQASIEGSSGSDFFSTHPLHDDRYQMATRLLPLAQERYRQSLKGRKNNRKKKRAPPPPTITYQLAKAEEALADNDLQTATTIAQTLTTQAPSSPETYNLLGRVKALAGEEKQAVKALKKGLSLAPEDPILIYNMGCLQAREGKRQEALTSLQKAFTLRPSLTTTAPNDPDLESLYEDPDFKSLLVREYVAPPPVEVGGNTVEVN